MSYGAIGDDIPDDGFRDDEEYDETDKVRAGERPEDGERQERPGDRQYLIPHVTGCIIDS
jgi:hypothetical protein